MKSQGVKAIVVVMVALLMAGCSRPISQIRLTEPDLTFTSNSPPKEVAKCIDFRARAETRGSIWHVTPTVALEERPNQTYHIFLTLPGYPGLADILVKPSGSGSVVEYRMAHWWGGEKEFLEILEQCNLQAGEK